MPIQIVDGFGVWDELGTVEPAFENWLDFPDFTYNANSLLRIQTASLNFDRQTYGYIRCLYELENIYSEGRWLRFYPKFNPQFLTYPHDNNIINLKSNPKKIFQVMKRHKFRRLVGTKYSNLWRVNLNVFADEETTIPSNLTAEQEQATPIFLNA